MQQLISELTDEFEDDDSGDKPKRKETLVKNLLRKVEGAVEESLPEATEVRMTSFLALEIKKKTLITCVAIVNFKLRLVF